MNSIDKLKKKVSDNEATREKMQREISALEIKVRQKAEAAQQMAEDGNTQGYRTMKSEKEDAEAELYVKRVQLNKLSDIPKEETVDAWGSYVGSVNKDLRKRMDEYLSMRHELADCFRAIAAIARESFEAREFCAKICGLLTGDSLKDKDILVTNYPVDVPEGNVLEKDIDFFRAINEMSPDEAIASRLLLFGQIANR